MVYSVIGDKKTYGLQCNRGLKTYGLQCNRGRLYLQTYLH